MTLEEVLLEIQDVYEGYYGGPIYLCGPDVKQLTSILGDYYKEKLEEDFPSDGKVSTMTEIILRELNIGQLVDITKDLLNITQLLPSEDELNAVQLQLLNDLPKDAQADALVKSWRVGANRVINKLKNSTK